MSCASHHSGESCWREGSGRESTSSSETMDVLSEYLWSPVWDVFGWVGLVVLTLIFASVLVKMFGWVGDILSSLGRPKDLVKVYGRWAVVTGGTDGIGKGYAMELARKGLNICLISRNEDKLINVANEIKSLHDVEVRWIKADFGGTDIYELIEKELSTIDDIGILVNNVGIAPEKWEAFCNHDNKYMLTSININMTSCVMMTHIILKHMIPKNRGLIVNVGSMSSLIPLPYGAVYSSTKTFIDNFTLCLATELSDTKIDLQCLRPGFVRTNLISQMKGLTKFFERVVPFLLPDVKTFTRSAVKTLNGSVPLYTCGFWAHSMMASVVQTIDMFSRRTVARIANLLMKYCWGAITKPKITSQKC
uniref:Inactive hydroxysteroid dehydrogenase-like protein 1 n=2 Tax=Lygus hesperus TaxID=30085 RepID=A0A0A9ZC68_LYGHE